MRFTISCLTAILAYTSTTTALPQNPAQPQTLQDFQVTAASVFTPSGRPESYPWATLRANITDPNEYNLGTSDSDGTDVIIPAGSQGINCIAKYYVRGGPSVVDQIWPCDPTSKGYWIMQVQPGTSGQYAAGDFNLKFTHVADVLYRGAQYTATFEAEGNFRVGTNMEGSCGGSGVCGWSLKASSKPALLKAKKVGT